MNALKGNGNKILNNQYTAIRVILTYLRLFKKGYEIQSLYIENEFTLVFNHLRVIVS